MRIIAASVLGLCLASCNQMRNKPAPPPKFPDPKNVARIEFDNGNQSISNPDEIGAFLSEISQVRTDWSFIWHTYPGPQKSVFLQDSNNRTLCRVDFGPRWIGSNCGQEQGDWPPLAQTSVAQDQFFQKSLGTKWEQ